MARAVSGAYSGGENKDHNPPRGVGYDYIYPSTGLIDYVAAKGGNVIRVPFKQRVLLLSDIAALDKVVAYAQSKGVNTILDLHQYGKINGLLVGRDPNATEDLTAFWQILAKRYASKPGVMLGIMNEPNIQNVAEWFAAAKAVHAGIRSVNTTIPILMPGTGWSGAHSWVKNGNAAAFDALPADPYLYADVHQYLDTYSTGQGQTPKPGYGTVCLKAATEWARARKRKLALTEFGFGTSDEYMREAYDALTYMRANSDVWKIFTGWTMGAWYPDSYFTKLNPLADKLDRPQLKLIMSKLRG